MTENTARTYFLRGVFIFMALTMFGGYTFAMFAGTPIFQELTGVGYSGPDSALEDALEALNEDPNDLDALQDVGVGYATLAQQPGGEVETNSGTRVYPEYTEAERDRFMRRAIRAFQTYLEERPEDRDTALSLAQAYDAAQEYEKAGAVYERLTRRDPENRDLFFAWGSSAIQGQDYETAARALDRFVKIAPNDPRAQDARQAIKDIKAQLDADASAPTVSAAP